jgi:two-component system sensor histidine kinase DegS
MVANLSPKFNIQHERLQALYHLAVELSALRSLESVLDVAMHHCLELTDSQFGFIGLNSANGKAMDVVAMQGFYPSEHFYQHNHLIPLRPNIFARAVLENRPVRSEDATLDPRRLGQPEGHPPVVTFLGVPLRIQDVPIGMIGVANRPQPYDDEHEQLLLTYAAQVAIVIRNTQLYEELALANEALERKVSQRTEELEEAKEALARKALQLQQLFTETVDVQERERQRIAQDMHDGINQLLVGAMLELKSARKRLTRGKVIDAGVSLDSVKNILHRVDAEIRRVIYDLHPPTLDALGLVPALRRYAERFEKYSNIPCTVQLLGEPMRLTARDEISVYRLMQEALQNVSTHAQAKRAEVVIVFSPKTLKLTVLDDGQGFDLVIVQQNNLGHLGLLSMQERAESLGGRLNIATQVGQGTRVELSVPVRPIGLSQVGP